MLGNKAVYSVRARAVAVYRPGFKCAGVDGCEKTGHSASGRRFPDSQIYAPVQPRLLLYFSSHSFFLPTSPFISDCYALCAKADLAAFMDE